MTPKICDKWHRYCTKCGNKEHVHTVRDSDECPECGAEGRVWSRDKSKVTYINQ